MRIHGERHAGCKGYKGKGKGMAIRLITGVVLAACSFLSVASAGEMQWLDDTSLSGITGGGTGMAFDIAMQLNTDSTGTPVGNATNNCNTNGTGCPFLLALQFENRAGSWLVLKNFYGLMQINNLDLDAYVNPTTNVNLNKNRYITAPYQSTQTCISDISSCNPSGMGSFLLSFNDSAVNYNNIRLYLNIGRMAVEFDKNVAGSCTSVNDTANCGYAQDAQGSFAGVLVADASAAVSPLTVSPAQISVQGQVRVYGF